MKVPIIVLIICVLGMLTYRQNELWRDPVKLWNQSVKYSPNKPRCWTELSKAYLQQGEDQKAFNALNTAIEKQGYMTEIQTINMVVCLQRLGDLEAALGLSNIALSEFQLSAINRSKLLVNRGNIYMLHGIATKAVKDYQQALIYFPQNIKAKYNLKAVLTLHRKTTI